MHLIGVQAVFVNEHGNIMTELITQDEDGDWLWRGWQGIEDIDESADLEDVDFICSDLEDIIYRLYDRYKEE